MGNNITLHAEGSPVCSFKSSARVPVEGLRAYFSPKQSGTDDPSPSNVRTISGWNGIEVERCGKNLYDISTATIGSWIRAGSISDSHPLGEIVEASGYTLSDYIEVKPSTAYFVKYFRTSNATAAGMVYFTSNKVAISGVNLKTQTSANNEISYEFTTPSNCYYLRLSYNSGSWNPPHLEAKSSTYPVHWNQWCKPLNADNWQAYNTSHNTVTFEDGVATSEWLSAGTGYQYSIKSSQGIAGKNREIWYISYMVKSNTSNINWGCEYLGGYQETWVVTTSANTWYQCSGSNIFYKGNKPNIYIAYCRTANIENLVAQVKAPIAINLTQMFGPGNEPTKEEFEEQCALNGIDLTAAIPYDEGSLKEWKTTKNLWKNTVKFPVFGKNKFNINVPYAEPSDTTNTTSTKRIFQPYTYCTGSTFGNLYNPDQISNCSISNSTLTFTSKNTSYGIAFPILLLPGTYTLSYTGENVVGRTIWYASDGTYINGRSSSTIAIPPTAAMAVVLFFPSTANTTSTVSNIQIEDGITATTYEPFSTDNTVYGGYVDLASGNIVKEWDIITSYNGETLPGEWISDRDVYVAGTTPITGAQVCYKLTTPIVYTLTSTQLLTFLGSNSIWSNASDTITCDYDLHETRGITEAKRRIAANQPHIAAGGASFNTDMKAPLESLKVEFAPVQAGTGDPSPTNIRPITGWSKCSVTKGKKNIGHVVGYKSGDQYLGYLSPLSGSYGQTLSTINYSLPDTPVTITQTQYDSTIAINHYKNGYMCVTLDKLTSEQNYDFSFKISNITSNPLNAQLSDIKIGTPNGWQYGSPTIINNTLIFTNKKWKLSSTYPNRKNLVIYYCGMSFTLSEFMVTPANTSDGVFEPYEGSIIPVEFPATRKNLFNKDDITLQEGLSINSSNKISAVNSAKTAFVPCLPNTTYTISKVATEVAKCGYINVAALPPTGTLVYGSIDMANLTTATITTGNDATYLMVYMNNTSYGSVTHETVLNSLQVEEGSSATTYEPYIQYYGGYVDLVTGELVAEYEYMTDTWGNWGTVTDQGDGTELRYKKFTNPVYGNGPASDYSYCNVAKYSYNNNNGRTHFYIVGNSYNCRIYLPSNTDTSTVIQAVGKLITPIHYQLTPTQLKSFIGTNNIDASTGGTITTKFWTH